jgi:protein-S-isoprenylcysteine O-methyltransferase Ste14
MQKKFESNKNILHSRPRWVSNLVLTFIGIMGLRIDVPWRWKYLSTWFFLWIGVLSAYASVFEYQIVSFDDRTLKIVAVTYAGFIWFTYYTGLVAVLGSRLRLLMIEKLGEERAYQLWQMSLGIIFLNQGLCQAAIIKVFGFSFHFYLPPQLILFSGGFLILTGTTLKIWATYLVGLDIYYYKDLFLNRITRTVESEPYVKSGPYKFFSNPMYGVGNLQAYGAAIWYLSWPGLVIAVVFQISIYVFYYLIERPFIHTTYLKPIVIKD